MKFKNSITFLVFIVSVLSVFSLTEVGAQQVAESVVTESRGGTIENDVPSAKPSESCNSFIQSGAPEAPQGCELMQTKIKNACHAYYHCKTKLNWHMAGKFCKKNGMSLAVVDNPDVFNNLAAILKQSTKTTAAVGFWIGGSDLGNEGNWYWATNGKLLVWTKWHPTEPNGSGFENCLGIYKHSVDDPLYTPELGLAFNDGPCSITQTFVCQCK